MESKPKSLTIIWNNYVTMTCFLLIVISIPVGTYYTYKQDDPTILMFVGMLNIIFIMIGVVKIGSVKNVFKQGTTTEGKITYIQFYRDRGVIKFHYQYQGETYKGSHRVMKTKRTKRLKAREDITVYLDSNHPQKAYIKEVYL